MEHYYFYWEENFSRMMEALWLSGFLRRRKKFARDSKAYLRVSWLWSTKSENWREGEKNKTSKNVVLVRRTALSSLYIV